LEGQGRPNAGEEPKKQKSRIVVGVQLKPRHETHVDFLIRHVALPGHG
jgi:hypothetical protein